MNKSKDPKVIQAKSRIVIPGHTDPGLGEFRSDSPTTTPTAIRMMKSLCVSRHWTSYVFDVATAFLSGKNTNRLVYVRAPKEGLPATEDSTTVGPYELMQVVKSAYGLSEAPRLWYLRACELLQQVGMTEIPFCRSTFIAADEKGCFAFCGLHVDDGFLAGDPKNPKFEALRQKINESFNIKSWDALGPKGVDYLGMKVRYFSDKNILVDDMSEYVLKIVPMEPPKHKEKLTGEELTKFRQLVMRMRWPSQHVFPEYMHRISSLAQRVNSATCLEVKEANDLLTEMHESARHGGACLTYRPLKGKPAFVTYFDAALGKKTDGTAQSGEFHLLTCSDVKDGESAANIIEFHSKKISRVVRSSLAAESCALCSASEHQLYNRLLFEALCHGRLHVGQDWRDHLSAEGILVTDAKALFNHCNTTGHLAQERQTVIF